MKRTWLLFVLLAPWGIAAWAGEAVDAADARPRELSVDWIMRDSKWIGPSPSDVFWSDDGKWIYFDWNPERNDADSLYVAPRAGGEPRKLTQAERAELPAPDGDLNQKRTLKVYGKDGDLFLLEVKRGRVRRITDTVERESDPQFTGDETRISFLEDGNLFLWSRDDGSFVQLTDFREGEKEPDEEEPATDQERWLKQEELKLIRVLRERKEKKDRAKEQGELEEPERPLEIYVGKKRVEEVRLSPDVRYVTFRLAADPPEVKRTEVPSYVVENGFTGVLDARPKVGMPRTTYELGIYDLEKRTVRYVETDSIPGIDEAPAYLEEQGPDGDAGDEAGDEAGQGPREVIVHGPYWSEDAAHAVVVVLSLDNKDRWIMALDPESGQLRLLDRQHDEAWIGGPGVRGWVNLGNAWRYLGAGNVGWMPDDRRFWFQSEESGYSHLYTVDMESGEKQALTGGEYEIYAPRISRDEKSWYFTSNQTHPGERHLYRMPIEGGQAVRITGMTGSNQAILSPDEKKIALLHSTSTRPWELFVMDNRPGAPARRITQSLSEEFLSYPWREPEFITFTASDGATVHARLYRPADPEPGGAAVVFVHGAGYLQNAHKWWSSYFREYMFHNLLADRGYTVLDVDYRGSAGYGRDWRTAIYRHMGGKDLSDQVDAARYLVETLDIDPARIGIYGGSYGGFIAFMAMFTEPGVFAAGAALRPVTDWAHYNDPYTANILNVPYADSLAYVRSSPIYFAEGLEGALLICHGVIDTNVHFQDVVRLVQRLIELGKENWELAIYPLEGHGFKEPSSWTDEYKRVLELFEENLN